MLNYYGNKNSIADEIIETCCKYQTSKFGQQPKYFFDLFGGGGSVSLKAIDYLVFEKVFYNEIKKDLCDLLKLSINGIDERDLFKFISKDEFLKLRKKEHLTPLESLYSYVYSFNCGGKNASYSMSKLQDEVKFICDFLLGKYSGSGFEMAKTMLNSKNYKSAYKHLVKELKKKCPLLRINTFERLFRIYFVSNNFNTSKLQISNDTYLNFDFVLEKPEECLIYADIPYQDKQSKASYKGVYSDDFNIDEFNSYVFDLAKRGFIVFVSEYDVPSADYKEIFSIKKRVLNKKYNFEKIFIHNML